MYFINSCIIFLNCLLYFFLQLLKIYKTCNLCEMHCKMHFAQVLNFVNFFLLNPFTVDKWLKLIIYKEMIDIKYHGN